MARKWVSFTRCSECHRTIIPQLNTWFTSELCCSCTSPTVSYWSTSWCEMSTQLTDAASTLSCCATAASNRHHPTIKQREPNKQNAVVSLKTTMSIIEIIRYNMIRGASLTCAEKLNHTHTHTHVHLMALFPGLPRWASTRKVKPIWILLKQKIVSGSGISWAICKSAPRSRQITMPAPHRSLFYRPDALPATQPTASKHWRQQHGTEN